MVIIGLGNSKSALIAYVTYSGRKTIIAENMEELTEWIDEISVFEISGLIQSLEDRSETDYLRQEKVLQRGAYDPRTARKAVNQRFSMPVEQYGALLRKGKQRINRGSYNKLYRTPHHN